MMATASEQGPTNTTNKSQRLVGGIFHFIFSTNTTNKSLRLVGMFIFLYFICFTNTNESLRLVGVFLFISVVVVMYIVI
jgi:amino acid permease